jgi:hypothetical protein
MIKSFVLAVCVVGLAHLGGASVQAQGIAFGVPVYSTPVYAAPVYPTTYYPATVYPTAVYPSAVYPATAYAVPDYTTYYAPAAVYPTAAYPVAAYASPYAVAAPVVVGTPARVYGYWGRHHAHIYYRW